MINIARVSIIGLVLASLIGCSEGGPTIPQGSSNDTAGASNDTAGASNDTAGASNDTAEFIFASADLEIQRVIECLWSDGLGGKWWHKDKYVLDQPACLGLQEELLKDWTAQGGAPNPNFLLTEGILPNMRRSREEEERISRAYEFFQRETSDINGFWSTVRVVGREDNWYRLGDDPTEALDAFVAKQLPQPNLLTFSARTQSESNWLKDWTSELHPTHEPLLSLMPEKHYTQKWQCIWSEGRDFNQCSGLLRTKFFVTLTTSDGEPFWRDEEAPFRSMSFSLARRTGWDEPLSDLLWSKSGDAEVGYAGASQTPYVFPNREYSVIEYAPASSFPNVKLAYTGAWARREILEVLTGERVYEGDIVTIVGRPASIVFYDGHYRGAPVGIVLTDLESISVAKPPSCESVTEGFCIAPKGGLTKVKLDSTSVCVDLADNPFAVQQFYCEDK